MQEVLSPWRAELCEAGKAGRPPRRKAPEVPAGRRLSPRRAAALLLKSDGALKPAQSDYIGELLEECPELGSLRTLGREFSRIVRERDAVALERCLDRAESCEVGELREFMAGIRRDRAAVEAALTYEWSSGQVEGR